MGASLVAQLVTTCNGGDSGSIPGLGRSAGEIIGFPFFFFSGFLGFPCDSAGKESACNAGDLGWIPILGRSLGEGKGYPLQYSGLENSGSQRVGAIFTFPFRGSFGLPWWFR